MAAFVSYDRAGAAAAPRRAEHRFFTCLGVAIVLATLLGFARTYWLVPWLGLPADSLPYTTLVHVHGAVAFAWCLLFAVQASLVGAGRLDVHRRLGALAVVLYLLLVGLGPPVAVLAAVRYGASVEELKFLAVSLGSVLAYTLLFGVALHLRRRPAVHKRLMVLGMVVMLSAPFGRLTSLPFLLDHVIGPGLFVLLLAWWDQRSIGRVHRVTLIGGLAVLCWQVLPIAYSSSGPWLALAAALTRWAG